MCGTEAKAIIHDVQKNRASMNLHLFSPRNISLFVFWTLLILVSMFLQTSHKEEEVKKLAVIEANTAFNKDSTIRMWVANHGGIYVLSGEQTPPNPYLSHIPDRDIVTPSGKKLTLVNAAYLMRQLLEATSNQAGSKSKITSLNPLNPINKPDLWEREALIKLEKGKDEVMEFAKGKEEPLLLVVKPSKKMPKNFISSKSAIQGLV